MKKLLLLLLAATLSLGFTACSDDDDDYPTLAQRNADKIRSLGITKASVYFNAGSDYSVDSGLTFNIKIDGDFLVLTRDDMFGNYTAYVPLDAIKEIWHGYGEYRIYLF